MNTKALAGRNSKPAPTVHEHEPPQPQVMLTMLVNQVNKIHSIKHCAPDLGVPKLDTQEFGKIYIKFPNFFKYKRQYLANDAKENSHKDGGVGIESRSPREEQT
jgi:hypothetical protein